MNKKTVAQIVAFSTVLLPMSAFAASSNSEQIDELNSLLKGEMSAVQTYTQALKKIDTQARAEKLADNLQDHQEAVDALRAEIVSRGGQPVNDSGAWGVWANTVQGTSNLLGDKAALKALKEGEEHGLKEYQEALKDNVFPEKTANLITSKLIENQVEHIRELDETLERVS